MGYEDPNSKLGTYRMQRLRAPLLQQRTRVGPRIHGTKPMHESSTRAQERSDVQAFDCPNCGDGLQVISRRGPTDATAQPCGCAVGHLPASAFSQNRRANTEASR